MKNNWPVKKLGEVTEINPKKSEIASLPNSTEVSFVPMSAVDDISGAIVEPEVKRLGRVRKGYTYFAESDVLFAKITPCMENGKVALAKNLLGGVGFGSTEFHVIRVGDRILPEIIYFLLRRESFRKEAGAYMTGTAGQRRVPREYLENVRISVPPLKTQKEIVERLDAIRQAQELNRKQISLADELFSSLIQKEILNDPWEEVPLREVVRDQEFINPKKQPNETFNYVEISSIDSEIKQIMEFGQVLGKEAPSRARKVLRDGDTVWSTVRPYLKNIAHVRHLPDPKVASTGFCVLSPKPSVLDHNWLYYNVSSDWFVDRVLPFQRGAAYPAVSDDDILDQTIKFATLKEQRKIVEKLSAVQEYKKQLLKQKELFQELFDSVLDRCMKGELVK